MPPLDEAEVIKTAQSAWSYTERDLNRFGEHGAWLRTGDVLKLIVDDQDAMTLLTFLRASNAPWSTFMITNTLAEKFGWRRERMAAARRRLLELGYVTRATGISVPLYRPTRPIVAFGYEREFRWNA
jgi:hypothetical protein